MLLVEKLSFQALSSKSTIAELSLAENELGVKGAMLAVRKAGLDVERVHVQRGETNTAFISNYCSCLSKRWIFSMGCDNVMTGKTLHLWKSDLTDFTATV